VAESLTTADGKPLDLQAAETQFARAMAAPPADPDLPAPPKREVNPPDGDDHQADKPAKPRPKPVKPRAKAVTAPKADYSAEASEFVANAWLLAAVVPYTSPYATVISGSRDALIPALAEGAKHSETIRQWVAGTSEHAWKVHLTMAAVQMSLQAWTIYRDPVLRKACEAKTRAELAEAMGTAVDEDSANGGAASPE
jgi:hypothetical protein